MAVERNKNLKWSNGSEAMLSIFLLVTPIPSPTAQEKP